MEAPPLNELAELAASYINTTERHIFLTGNAGTGKTTFLRYIVDHTYKNAVVAAPTGIAAINAGGVTLHSLLQLPFGAFIPENTAMTSASNLQVNTPLTLRRQRRFSAEKLKLIREMDLLIIDEVSMLRADLLDCMDLVLRSIRRRGTEPFGGLQILFIGDLMQLPPVVKEAEWGILKQYYRSAYFFEAQALRQQPMLCVELKKIYRQADQDFIDILNRLRHNEQTEADIERLNQHYRPDIDAEKSKGYIHLTTHNYKADRINQERLWSLPEKARTYEATVEGDFPEKLYPVPFALELKPGAQVMFIKNDPSGEGRFFNGKIGVVSRLEANSLCVTCEDGQEIEVEPYTWENKQYKLDETKNEIEEQKLGSFIQYPLRLAWAVTIHKSQGLTFEKAILDMADTFAPGQLYVALSRLTSLEGLVLSSPLPQRPPSIDDTLRAFVSGFPDADALSAHLRVDRQGFLWKFAQAAFDFGPLLKSLEAHAASFNKQENRSLKQQYLAWTQSLIEDTRPLQETGSKFIGQVGHLLLQPEGMSPLAGRIEKAQAYFEPILLELIQRLRAHREALGSKKAVKTYREELESLADAYIHQIRQIMKISLLVQESSAGRVPSKEKLRSWEAEFHARVKPAKKKKIPTATQSFQLFKAGKNIAEIAAERGMAVSTIEGHLTGFIETGEVDILEIMSEERLDHILDVAMENGVGLGDVKAQLGPEYSYGEIKMAIAHARWRATGKGEVADAEA